MKTLLLDIETSPNLAYVWGIWEQNIALNQMVTNSKTLCWAAKWQDKKEVMFDSVYKSSEKKMLSGVHKLLDEADAVIHYNGKKFDIPTLNKEFLLNNMPPPSPYRQIDMLHVARQMFRFQSNKLDHVSQQLGIGRKTSHEGFKLWVDCMANDKKAWAKMEKYNKNDVVLLEDVYNRMRPWIPNHPNAGVYRDGICCPRCGKDTKIQSRGVYVALGVKYQRYQCQACGGWMRGGKVKDHQPVVYRGV